MSKPPKHIKSTMTHRHLVQFDSAKLPRIDTDFLIIGAGSAGLSAAAEASQHGDVLLITKTSAEQHNVPCTQREITSPTNKNVAVDSHIQRTLKAGGELCNERAVDVMVKEGVKHAPELMQSLTNHWEEGPNFPTPLTNPEKVQFIEQGFVIDFMTQGDRCYGVVALLDDTIHCIFARATILASGGLGHIYQCTSNRTDSTGDGFAAAWRAGCDMIDMEFVQFYPTTLFLTEAPHLLISGKVREEGGILINSRGERFMRKYHEMEELAPGDLVSRAILNEMELTGTPCVYLDITHLSADFIRSRFTSIYQFCDQYGIDITTDVIPIRSGAHFMIGGVCTTLNTETTLRGLFACGEVACTGVHGASQLGNNPLLECIVFGTRAGSAAAEYTRSIQSDSYANVRICSEDDSTPSQTTPPDIDISAAREVIQKMMWQHVGLVRSREQLERMLDEFKSLKRNRYSQCLEGLEFQNMCDVALVTTEAALMRTESRGTHYREDFPEQDNFNWKKHLVLQREVPARTVASRTHQDDPYPGN